MSKKIQIVCFAPPYPDDYGGLKDVWSRVQAFALEGYAIYLHCFVNNREALHPLIYQTCTEVYTYTRSHLLLGIFTRYPLFIYSRKSPILLHRLINMNAPILLEGAHCSLYAQYLRSKNKKVIIRIHNIEQKYYHYLSAHEGVFWKRLYYKIEAKRLIHFEKNKMNANVFLHINDQELIFFQKNYPSSRHLFTPIFSVMEPATHAEEFGSYVLIHGNLSITENHQATIDMIDHLLQHIEDTPVIVAGKNPNKELRNHIAKYNHITLIENPTPSHMKELIAQAQVICNHSITDTGLKLKVVESLLYGRHVMINTLLNHGQRFSEVCTIAHNWDEYRDQLKKLLATLYTSDMQESRKQALTRIFQSENAISLIEDSLQHYSDR